MNRPPIDERQGAVEVIQTLRDAGHEAFLVGGCVRDTLLGRTPREYDIATGARPEEVQKLFKRTVGVGAQFGVILVLWKGREYEVATFRAEADYTDGRRPDSVSFVSAREDVIRRDFTINGMLEDPVAGEIRDFVEGRKDLDAGIIRAIGPAQQRFEEDHLRMLRAVRFATTLGFEIETDTLSAIIEMASHVTSVSGERVHSELTRVFAAGDSERGFILLTVTGLLDVLIPETIALDTSRCQAMYRELGACSLPIALAVVLSDVDESSLAAVAQRLRLSNQQRVLLQHIVSAQPRFEATMSRSATLRFIREPWWTHAARVNRAACVATDQSTDTVDALESTRVGLSEDALYPPRLMNGEDLKNMGLQPGPQFKDILTALEDAQLEGAVRTRDEADAFVRQRMEEMSE
jgi:poly(A) polymerase